jgi:hypothetical protein
VQGCTGGLGGLDDDHDPRLVEDVVGQVVEVLLGDRHVSAQPGQQALGVQQPGLAGTLGEQPPGGVDVPGQLGGAVGRQEGERVDFAAQGQRQAPARMPAAEALRTDRADAGEDDLRDRAGHRCVPEAALPLRVPTASFTRAAARVPADGGAPSLGLSAAASA